MYFMILHRKIFFQNIKIKLNSNAWMTEVLSSDFPSLKTSAASMTSVTSTASMASMTSTASFYQKNTHPHGLRQPFWNFIIPMKIIQFLWYQGWVYSILYIMIKCSLPYWKKVKISGNQNRLILDKNKQNQPVWAGLLKLLQAAAAKLVKAEMTH